MTKTLGYSNTTFSCRSSLDHSNANIYYLCCLKNINWGNGMWLISRLFAWVPETLVSFPLLHKPKAMARRCNPSTREVKAGGSGVQSYLQLDSKSETSVGYMKP